MSSSSLADFSRPCPKNGYYDIFLSFRGKDTRHGFTNNLYHSLQQNNVYTFMDIKLMGEDIDYLFKVIAKSMMAVVIYSKNFPSSDWCLRELELILQLRKEKKMLMIPIFYNIDLHELKRLTGDTVKYLDTHISKHGEITVQKWKDAVISFGHVSGLSYKDTYNRSEYDFIKDVTGRIKEKLRECEEPVESYLNKPNYYKDDRRFDVYKLLITIISCCMNDHPTVESCPIPQFRQEHIGCSTQSFPQAHTNTTTGEDVVTSAYFEKSEEIVSNYQGQNCKTEKLRDQTAISEFMRTKL